MLIMQMGQAALYGDGLIDAPQWRSLEALKLAWHRLEQEQRDRTAADRVRCRQARARAIARGHRAGMALATRRHVALSSALAQAAMQLQAQLAASLDQRIEALLSAHGPERGLAPELRRCLGVAWPQPVVSIRVCAANLAIARAQAAEVQAGASPPGSIQVLADASLGSTCCVVETPSGPVRGTLTAQIAAVRLGLQDAARQQLQDLFAQWQASA